MADVNVLVLIPDSTRKRKGSVAGTSGPTVGDALIATDLAKLTALRKKVASAADLAPGPDIDPASKSKVDLMPAYLRYDGNMYRHIPRETWESRKAGVEVAIVSALYGLVLSREPIRAYGFSMAESLPGLGTLHSWWRESGLPALLASSVKGGPPERIVDLLSLEYRKAVDRYRDSIDVPVEVIDFPGLGRASQPRRGEAVADILRGTR
ncbi:MAG: hypothetical protein A3K65_00825 [Euryarchaeota archaeon RBG_16_68_12]|nr:MAG: hypothetical protein A3K65_00825 [Euryarchaeota archaeon RBG_16_68_12]